jgi:hypothetical protein
MRITRSCRSRANAAVAASALLAAGALPLVLGAAQATATVDPSCSLSGGTWTCVFTYNGSTNTNGTAISWPVPAGVTALRVTADGGTGGNGTSAQSGAGGPGGVYQAALSKIPAGTTLSVFPGGAGGNAAGSAGGSGGVNGTGSGTSSGGAGANGASGGDGGGGGGGASAVFAGSAALLVAGGGGGAGADSALPSGGPGGGSGATSTGGGNGGDAPNGDGGNGGTGSGAAFGGACTGTAGATWTGGAGGGSTCITGGGGGGGGYQGGGGGSGSASSGVNKGGGGGGGGGSYPTGTSAVSLDGITVTPQADAGYWQSGNGQVTISFSEVHAKLRTWWTETRHGFTVYAALTLHGAGIAGQQIDFKTVWPRTTLCTPDTNAKGVASCKLTGTETREFKRSLGLYTASVDPGDFYAAATARSTPWF